MGFTIGKVGTSRHVVPKLKEIEIKKEKVKTGKRKGEIVIDNVVYLPTRKRAFYKHQFNKSAQVAFYNPLDAFSELSIHQRQRSVRILETGAYQAPAIKIPEFTVIDKSAVDSVEHLFNCIMVKYLVVIHKPEEEKRVIFDKGKHFFFSIECRKCKKYRPLLVRDKNQRDATAEAIDQYWDSLCDVCEGIPKRPFNWPVVYGESEWTHSPREVNRPSDYQLAKMYAEGRDWWEVMAENVEEVGD